MDISNVTAEEWDQLQTWAEASTPLALMYGQWKPGSVVALVGQFCDVVAQGDGIDLWLVHAESPERGPVTVCIAGNGPESEANAKFFSIARTGVLLALERARAAESRQARLEQRLRSFHEIMADAFIRHCPEDTYLGSPTSLAHVISVLERKLAAAKEAQDAA